MGAGAAFGQSQKEDNEPGNEPESQDAPKSEAGAEEDQKDSTAPVVSPAAPAARQSFFAPKRNPDRPRSDIGMPIVSLLLPGFDQWWEGQIGSAAVYSGIATGSILYVNQVQRSNGLIPKKGEEDKKDSTSPDDDAKKQKKESLSSKDLVQRKLMLGSQVYQAAGGFSAWHAFRTAAYSRQSQGQYEFLSKEETPADVLLAPFHFSYITRMTTWIPLTVGAGIATLILNSKFEDRERDKFTAQDAFFTSAYSFNAGTHEEAVFRGWMMPVMMEYWHSPFWANAAQSGVFALAHLGTTSLPIAQLVLGHHLGRVTQKNGWTLGESVFIHTWWDVIAFATMWQYRETVSEEKAALLPIPVLWLPPFDIRF